METISKTETKSARPAWMALVAQYHKPHLGKSIWQVASTFTGYFVLWYVMLLSLEVSYWLTWFLALPTALFFVRIFALQHDCGHLSLFKSSKLNTRIGILCSLFTLVPFHYWKRKHALHHASAGHMDHRGVGDIYTMTVKEYLDKPLWDRIVYRVYRHPFILFLSGPIFVFIIGFRYDFDLPKSWKRERLSLRWTNITLMLLIIALMWVFGWKEFLMVQLPITYIATCIGSWFFFIQHNYEDAYWAQKEDWDYTVAALKGSSYYKLPKILQWFTASVGFHHIHHLSPKIPNYLLEKCHKENPIFQTPVTLTLLTGF
ncbi:MAG: fatty acid desaturase, partial [Chloroflexota bacterium]